MQVQILPERSLLYMLVVVERDLQRADSMNKIILLTIVMFASLGVYGQSPEERPTPPIQLNARGRTPRPSPPPCCRPFRSTGITWDGTASIIGGVRSVVLTSVEDNLEAYRVSLENYRIEVEAARKSLSITKEEYIAMLDAYKDRIGEYIEEYKKRD